MDCQPCLCVANTCSIRQEPLKQALQACLAAVVHAQRLLWEVEGNLAFGPPTVDQHRNAHTLLRDFGEELDLYSQAGDLMQLLTEWRPAAGADLPKMMVDLADAMVAAKMWAQASSCLADSLGYVAVRLVSIAATLVTGSSQLDTQCAAAVVAMCGAVRWLTAPKSSFLNLPQRPSR